MNDKRTAELAKRAKKGDEEAFTELIESNIALIYYIAREYINEEDDVDDVVQLTIIRVWEKIHLFNYKTSPFRIWLSILCSSVYKNFIRDYKSQFFATTKIYRMQDKTTYDTYAEDKYEKEYYKINRLKEILNEEDYNIIYMKYVLEYSDEEIAHLYGYKNRKSIYEKLIVIRAKIIYNIKKEFKVLKDTKTEEILSKIETKYDIKVTKEEIDNSLIQNKRVRNYEPDVKERYFAARNMNPKHRLKKN